MMFMYVDESGDIGKYVPNYSKNSPHFILSGLIISQNNWQASLHNLKNFRKEIKNKYGLLLQEEIHAAELIRVSKIASYKNIRKTNRLKILQLFLNRMPIIFPKGRIINVCLDKKQFATDTDFMELAWKRLIQRYDTFLKKTAKDKGIIVADDTNSILLRNLLRKMRVFNYVPSQYNSEPYNAPIKHILEDPFMRDSKHSYFIQAADCIAHSLYRKEFPKGSLRKFGTDRFFDALLNLLVKEASASDKNGIVRK